MSTLEQEIGSKVDRTLNPKNPSRRFCAEHHFMSESYFFVCSSLGDLHHTQKTGGNPDRQAARFVM
jgi:hypothetical protein